jgi:hypothetical protein
MAWSGAQTADSADVFLSSLLYLMTEVESKFRNAIILNFIIFKNGQRTKEPFNTM